MELKLYITRASQWERLWRVLSSACMGLHEDNGFGIAKAVAYSLLLAFFPVITTLAAILVQAQAEAVSRTIARLLYDVVPPGTEDLVRTLFVVSGQRPKWLLVAATLLSVWAASGAMMSLMEGFRAVYRIPDSRSLVKERGMAMLLVFMSAIPILAASVLIVFSNRAQRAIIEWLGLSAEGAELRGWVRLAGQAMSFGVAVGGVVVVTGLVYYFGPNRRQSIRNVFPGALLATALWLEATLAFSWYVRNITDYNLLYGGVGAGLALLVWMYVLAVTLLLGCEYNARRERLLELPPP